MDYQAFKHRNRRRQLKNIIIMNYLVTQMTSVGSGKVLFASMSQIRSPWIFQLVTLAYWHMRSWGMCFKHLDASNAGEVLLAYQFWP